MNTNYREISADFRGIFRPVTQYACQIMSRAETPSRTETVPAETTSAPRILSGGITPARGAIAAATIALILYLLTMSPTFGFIDEGELAAVAGTLGVAHPTGYPTFTMLGYLCTLLYPGRDIVALNIMAALLVACSVGVMTLLFCHILRKLALPSRNRETGKGKGSGKKKSAANIQDAVTAMPEGARTILAASSALLVGSTLTWWEQGTGVEVYALHALMLPLVSLLFLRYMDQEEDRERAIASGTSGAGRIGLTRRGFLFALVLGLAFTNHLTTIHLAAGFLVYFFWTLPYGGWRDASISGRARVPGAWGRAFRRLLLLAPGFIIGLLPYLYLPLRASMEPRFNWGNPETLESFLRHVSGQVFQVYMFESGEAFRERTGIFLGSVPGELLYPGLLAALAGAFLMLGRAPRIFAWAALVVAGCMLHAGNYDIMEIAPYYMAAMLMLGVWCAAGYAWLYERAGRMPALGLAALLAVAAPALHYAESNERPNTLVEDMTVNMLRTLPPNAVIFSSHWDFWVAGSYYMQGIEGMRPDVLVVDQELLRRTWYLDEMEANNPEFMRRVAPQVERFRAEVRPFERGESYDAGVIQGAYLGMINAMIDSSIAARPVFVTSEVEPGIGARYGRVPNYLALRLVADTAYLPQEFPSYRFSFWPGRLDYYTSKIYELYALSLAGRMAYEGRHGNDSLAFRYRDYALTFDPGWTPAMVPELPRDADQEVLKLIRLFEGLRRL